MTSGVLRESVLGSLVPSASKCFSENLIAIVFHDVKVLGDGDRIKLAGSNVMIYPSPDYL